MLVLKRKEGEWVEATHRSGDVLRIRVCNIEARHPRRLDLAFEDDARNFSIQRPERSAGPGPASPRPAHLRHESPEGPPPCPSP